MFIKRLLLILFIFATLLPSSLSAIELTRRQSQFDANSGYLVFPTPYNLPGIGSGMMLIGSAGNAFDTNADAYIVAFQGDASGYFTEVSEVFLYPELLYVNYLKGLVTSFGMNSYSKRGMDTEKTDYNITVGDRYSQVIQTLTLTLYDRRLEVSVAKQVSDGRVNKVLTPEEDLIVEYSDPLTFEEEVSIQKIQLDLTDDFNDPRSGLRLGLTSFGRVANSSDSPDYTVLDQNASYFLPIGKQSTWVFHYHASSARVSRQGETDLETLKATNGFDSCASASDQSTCEAVILDGVNNTIAANTYGTASPVGGPNRLRSYPKGRYVGAQTRMFGTEFRWNISTEKTAIDWYLLSDVQEALQVAFFYENATVAETKADLGSITRSSTGAGIRLVTGSGSVYRFDVATGEEGAEVTLLFNYPWLPEGF